MQVAVKFPSTLSTAVAEKFTTLKLRPDNVAATLLTGQFNVGATGSTTVTEYEQVALLPDVSNAVQIIVTVLPKVKILLEGPPEQIVLALATATLSVAIGKRGQLYMAFRLPILVDKTKFEREHVI